MATILDGLNAISQAVGGAGEAESNLEALNQISEALGGSADATENADAIANIAENASGGAKPSGTIDITANGLHDVAAFEAANVNVPASAVVSGTTNIVQNGTVDVTNFAKANVNVPSVSAPTYSVFVNNKTGILFSLEAPTYNFNAATNEASFSLNSHTVTNASTAKELQLSKKHDANITIDLLRFKGGTVPSGKKLSITSADGTVEMIEVKNVGGQEFDVFTKVSFHNGGSMDVQFVDA